METCKQLTGTFAEEKDAEAIKTERAELPPGMAATTAPPNMTATRLTLPPELWPHNYMRLAIAVGITAGIFCALTLPISISAIVLAAWGRYQSKSGQYESAKTSSKLVLMLLVIATCGSLLPWDIGVSWTFGTIYTVYRRG